MSVSPIYTFFVKFLKPEKRKKSRTGKEPQLTYAKTEQALPVFDLIVVPPDGGWGWVVVMAAFISNMIVDGTTYCFGLVMKDIAKDLKVDESLVALANSVMLGLYFLNAPIACAMVNSLGFRLVGVMGGIVAAATMVAASYVKEVYSFIVAYGLVGGIAFSLTFMANQLCVGFYFDRWRAVANSIAVCGSAVGVLVFPILFNVLMSKNTWRTKYCVLAGGMVIVAAIAFTFIPLEPQVIRKRLPEVRESEESLSITSEEISENNSKSVIFKMRHNQLYPTYSEINETAPIDRSYSSFMLDSKLSSQWSRIGPVEGTVQEQQEGVKPKRKSCKRFCGPMLYHFVRPLYKDDIFHTGAMIPKESETAIDKMTYQMSVTRVTTAKDFEESTKLCVCCPESVLRTLATMLDFKLLKSSAFVCLAISGFYSFLAAYVPYVYIVDFAFSTGMSKKSASFLLCVIGISNGIGRLASGFIVMTPCGDALIVTAIGLSITGLSSLIIPFFQNEIAFYIYCVVFGFTLAVLPSLRPIIVVDMMGLQNLTNAYGILILFAGFAALSGTPIAAQIKNATKGDYVWVFIFSGVAILISVFFLIPVPFLMRWDKARAEKKERLKRERRLEETKRRLMQINMQK